MSEWRFSAEPKNALGNRDYAGHEASQFSENTKLKLATQNRETLWVIQATKVIYTTG